MASTCKAERLAKASIIAPVLRSRPPRTIHLVDAEGKVTGFTTDIAVAQSLLEKAKIEIAVDDGIRPSEVMCEVCGKLAPVAATGLVRKKCRACVEAKKLENFRIWQKSDDAKAKKQQKYAALPEETKKAIRARTAKAKAKRVARKKAKREWAKAAYAAKRRSGSQAVN